MNITQDGVYSIDPDGLGSFNVSCDMTKNGGGWTVFQRRMDGSVDFYLEWKEYKNSFGNMTGEFWLGLDKIHRLTKNGDKELRVDLEDFEGNKTFAKYKIFKVDTENEMYKLTVGNFTGIVVKSVANTISYQQATEICQFEGKELCSANEICSDGKTPYQGVIPGDHWVPVLDNTNEWIQIGNTPHRPCILHSRLGHKPPWGLTSSAHGFKGKLFCCEINARGDAGDSLAVHNGMKFSTKDKDNDVYSTGSCAVEYKGAWWYENCHKSSLNGEYIHGVHTKHAQGIIWKTWKGDYYSLKKTEMKIRPQKP